MAKIFLQLLFFSACFGICGIGESASQCGELWVTSVSKGTACPFADPFVNLLRVPPPEVAQQAGSVLSIVCEAFSTELEIQWYYITTEGHKFPVKNSFSAVQNIPFTIKSTVFLWANILTTVTSTLTIERLSAAYVGGYACTAVAGDIKVGSDVFQVLLSGRLRC